MDLKEKESIFNIDSNFKDYLSLKYTLIEFERII